MKREYIGQYSHNLNRELHLLVYGDRGVPLLAFPCQDKKCNDWENYQMPDTLWNFIETGEIQLFVVDAIDEESWSDKNGDKGHRAWMQECYYRYITEEAVPFIHEINRSDRMPIVTGFSLGATHAAIVFFRRPDLFAGLLACSGIYDARYFFDGWCNETLYNNSPEQFLENMPYDHPYLQKYNERRVAICVGQGAWEDECKRSTGHLKDILESHGIHAWVDFWGYDVNHDWPWWKKQILYFLPWTLGWY